MDFELARQKDDDFPYDSIVVVGDNLEAYTAINPREYASTTVCKKIVARIMLNHGVTPMCVGLGSGEGPTHVDVWLLADDYRLKAVPPEFKIVKSYQFSGDTGELEEA